MKIILALGFILALVALAPAGDLYIQPEFHSLHLGESMVCKVYFTRDFQRELMKRDWPYWKGGWTPLLTIPFNPHKAGLQQIGPVSISVGGEKMTAPAVPIHVLPAMGTNTVFEIRIYDTKIRKSETLEVVVQMQHKKYVPNPYYEVEHPEPHPFYLAKPKKNADWKGRSSYRRKSGGRSGSDGRGRYIIEGRTEIYQFTPQRTGKLKITKDLFRNLPAGYKFQTRVIAVTE
jgi:hypothetical protein